MVHARGEPQRRVGAVAIGLDQGRIGQQVVQRVGEALGLQQLDAVDRAAGADDGVARACKHLRVVVDRPRARLQRTREAGVQALEGLLPGITEIEIGEQAPDRDRRPRHDGVLDLAEPAHPARREAPGDAVRQQEVDVLLVEDFQQFRTQAHGVTGARTLSPRAERGAFRDAERSLASLGMTVGPYPAFVIPDTEEVRCH